MAPLAIGAAAASSVAASAAAKAAAGTSAPQLARLTQAYSSSFGSTPSLQTANGLRPEAPVQQRVASTSRRGSAKTASSSSRSTSRRASARAMAGETQKGWSYDQYGGTDQLKFGDVPLPSVADDQVLVRVAAAGLNPVDSKRRQGKFQATDSPLPTVPGYDVAGVVVKVGSAVTKFKEGDEVYSDINEAALNQPKVVGSLAQYTAVEEKLLALKPKNLSFIEAAAIPLAALTAAEGFERANFKSGQSVLIINGAGGVGTFAIQLAKKVYGASFVGTTASSSKADLVKGLGADLVVDYKTEDYSQRPEKYDFVLDGYGDGPNAVKAVKEGGVVLCLTGAIPEGGVASRYVLTSDGAKLAALTPYFEKGEIRPVIDPKAPFAFADVVAAFDHLDAGHATGKIVVGPIS